MSSSIESGRSTFNAYETPQPSSRFFADIIHLAVQEARASHKVAAVCFPTAPIVQHAFQGYISKFDLNGVTCDLTPESSEIPCRLVPYLQAISDACLQLCDLFFIVDGHLLATYDHVCILNRIFAEVQKKHVYFFADPEVSLNLGETTILNDFCQRFNAPPQLALKSSLPPPRHIPMQCALGNGVEFVSEKLPFYKALSKSRCPLTDALISTVGSCLASKLRCVVLCSSDSEAKEVAQRLDMAIGDLIPRDNVPNARIAMTSGIEVVGGIVLPTESPFSKKLSGFASRISQHPVPVIVGEKNKLLYYGIVTPVVINVIYSGNKKPFVEAEFAVLYNLACPGNSFIATISDKINQCYTKFTLSMKVFNKIVLNLVSEGKADQISDVSDYFARFFVPEVNAQLAIEELVANGSVILNGQQLEVLNCKYLSGFFAVEKRKFLSRAFRSFDFSDTLFMFFLANVYFVDTRDITSLLKTGIHTMFSDPEVKVLSDQIGLHDPRVSSAHFAKLESAVIVATLVHWYCLNDRPELLIRFLCGRDSIGDYMHLTLKNLRKTADISRDFFNCNFASVFKNLETSCFQFHTSSLRAVVGLDMTSIDSLILAGVKSVQHFMQYTGLEKHLRSLALRRNVAPKALVAELRRNAQNLILRSFDLNLSGNTSGDLFSTSINKEEVCTITYCAALNVELSDVFLPITHDETVYIHLSSSNCVSIIRISDTTTVFQFQLQCCSTCDDASVFQRVLQGCASCKRLYISDVLQFARICAQNEFLLNIARKSYCLKVICYITRSGGPASFLEDDVTRDILEAWPSFSRIVMSNGVFSQEFAQLLATLNSTLIKIVTHEVAKTVRTGINVLVNVYSTGIGYRGFKQLIDGYRKKLTTFPEDVLKIANSTFIPKDLHYALADDVGSLVTTKKGAVSKLVSTDAATNNQSNPFYTQLSQIRKLRQAIELLDEQYFGRDSGVLFPEISYGGHGRLYTTAPNLQNFAKSLPFADLPSPRSLICVDSIVDEMWSADFSEIEFRMAAVLSKDENLLAAIRSPDVFKDVSAKLGLSSAPRADVKLFFYGILYGMGTKTIEEQYGFSKATAKHLYQKFDSVFKQLTQYRNFLKDCVLRGQAITNYFGMPVNVDSSAAYAAVNGVIQSSAAYILLSALSKFDMSIPIRVLFTVHDEIVFTAPKSFHDAVIKFVPKWMQTTIEGIPFPIKLAVGPSWDRLVRLS
uniref:DNA-directed DNA polymerase n=1 Tax=Panagrellus redivivus TaxID=6233 RepID=A0A7E4ZVR4_PANRE